MRLTHLLALPLLVAWSRPPLASPPRIGGSTGPANWSVDSVPVTVRWNRLVPRFSEHAAARRKAARAAAAGDPATLRRLGQTPPPMPFHVYTLVSVAQLAAANAAQRDRAVSPAAAIASASAAVLSQIFQDSAVRRSIAEELERDLQRVRTAERGAERARAGKRAGDDIARGVIAWAPQLDLVGPWSGTVPKGRGMWYSAPGVPPIGASLGSARPWLLDSAGQFRPAPPPAFGSPPFDAALAEVRSVAHELTPEQLKIARRWNASDPWAIWNDVASAAITRHHVTETDAARVLAVLNAAATDAIIACFEAKYHYWTIRPSQADTTLALPDSIDLPNFPSYPSGHACSAGAFGAVLSHYIPQERAEYTRMAEEQAMSRLYGGIHYRFDNDAGLALGRTVAKHAVDRERHGGLNAWRSGLVGRRP